MRSDGNATYLAKDIAFHMWKFGVLSDNFKYCKVHREAAERECHLHDIA